MSSPLSSVDERKNRRPTVYNEVGICSEEIISETHITHIIATTLTSWSITDQYCYALLSFDSTKSSHCAMWFVMQLSFTNYNINYMGKSRTCFRYLDSPTFATWLVWLRWKGVSEEHFACNRGVVVLSPDQASAIFHFMQSRLFTSTTVRNRNGCRYPRAAGISYVKHQSLKFRVV